MPGAAGIAAKMLGLGGKALSWGARNPLVADIGIGAGAGFVTSGFSGWGALTGGVGGLIGGTGGRTRHQSNIKAATAGLGKARSQYRAANFSLREGRSQLGAIERGYRADSNRFYSAQRSYTAARRPAVRAAKRSGPVWERATAGAADAGFATRGGVQPSLSLARTELKAARAARRTSAADLGRIRGSVGQIASSRKQLGTNLATAAKQRRQLNKGGGLWGTGISRGAIAGGAIAGGVTGLISFASGHLGTSYGSQNQNPYGATFSGMGNGTVGGY